MIVQWCDIDTETRLENLPVREASLQTQSLWGVCVQEKLLWGCHSMWDPFREPHFPGWGKPGKKTGKKITGFPHGNEFQRSRRWWELAVLPRPWALGVLRKKLTLAGKRRKKLFPVPGVVIARGGSFWDVLEEPGGAAQSKRAPRWPAASEGRGLEFKPKINSLSGLGIHGLEDALDFTGRIHSEYLHCASALHRQFLKHARTCPQKCCSCFVCWDFCLLACRSSSFIFIIFFLKESVSQKVKGLCILEAEEAPGFPGLGIRWWQGLVPKGR